MKGIDNALGHCQVKHGELLPSLTADELRSCQESDRVVGKVIAYLKLGGKPGRKDTKNEDIEVLRLLRAWYQLCLKQGILYGRRKEDAQARNVFQLVIPEDLKEKAFSGIHNDVGHFSTERTLHLARSRFFWSGMAKDIEQRVKTCRACLLRRAPQPRQVAPLVNITSSEPLELVCIDYLKIEKCKGGYENILVITDHFTRYAQAIPTLNQTAKTTANVLFNKFIVHYGFPACLHSDQGRHFESKLIHTLCKIANISKTRTTPYHPMGNGMCERFNRTLLHMLGTLSEEQKTNWKNFVAPVVHAYNTTKHA
jgi:transposase InsO family protein